MKSKNVLFDSVGATFFAVIMFFFSFGMVLTGGFYLLKSFFTDTHQYLQACLLMSVGFSLIVGSYNIILFFDALRRISDLANTQAEILNKRVHGGPPSDIGSFLASLGDNVDFKFTALDGTDPAGTPKTFDSFQDMVKYMTGNRDSSKWAPPAGMTRGKLRSLENLSDEQLKAEKERAVIAQEYERAAEIREEMSRRAKLK